MFTGLVTVVASYMTIGLSFKIYNDDSNETGEKVMSLIKESVSWPKELYNKIKKD